MFTINRVKLLNYFVSLIPLSLILGNLAVNLNIIIICVLGLTLYGKKIFLINDEKYKYLIYLFFFYLIIITFFNNFSSFEENNLYKVNFFKSVFYLRFLILFLTINQLIENNKLNLKLFYISCAFFSFLVSFDIIFQIIFEKNLSGFEITSDRPSSFFGDENIAGGYLQKFILFFIFLIALNIKYKKNIFTFVLLIIFFIPIIITGNRMPALIYVVTVLLYFVMQKKLSQILFSIFFFILLIFFLLKNPINERTDIQLQVFAKDSIDIILKAPKLFIYNKYDGELEARTSGYLVLFNSGVQVWKKSKLFGLGLKSFALNCEYKTNQTCSTHPHNYFIEIMVSTGLLGLALIYSIFIITLFKFLKFYFSITNQNHKILLLPIYFITFFEFFPLRSTGSFFTTSNSVVIFLFLSLFINFKKLSFLKFKLKKK